MILQAYIQITRSLNCQKLRVDCYYEGLTTITEVVTTITEVVTTITNVVTTIRTLSEMQYRTRSFIFPSQTSSPQMPCIRSINTIYAVSDIPALQPPNRQGPCLANIPVLLGGAGASPRLDRQKSSPTSHSLTALRRLVYDLSILSMLSMRVSKFQPRRRSTVRSVTLPPRASSSKHPGTAKWIIS